ELNRNVSSVRPQVSDAQARLEVVQAVSGQPDWSLALSLLGRLVENDVSLTRCKLDPIYVQRTNKTNPKSSPAGDELAGVTVALEGSARSQAAVSGFVLRLERSGLFSRVDLLQSAREAGNELTTFKIECSIAQGQQK